MTRSMFARLGRGVHDQSALEPDHGVAVIEAHVVGEHRNG